MAICEKCKFRVKGMTFVVGYGELPEFRCAYGLSGGESVPCQRARKDGKAKSFSRRGKGLKCDNFRPATAQGGGQ